MRKLMLLILMCVMLIACSTPEERRATAEGIGKVVLQKYENFPDVSDIFVVQNKEGYFIIQVNSSGGLFFVKKINIQCDSIDE